MFLQYDLKLSRNSNQLLLMKVISYLSPCTFTKCIEQFTASSTPGWGNFEISFVTLFGFFFMKLFILKLIQWHNCCCECHKTKSMTKYACAKFSVLCFVVCYTEPNKHFEVCCELLRLFRYRNFVAFLYQSWLIYLCIWGQLGRER